MYQGENKYTKNAASFHYMMTMRSCIFNVKNLKQSRKRTCKKEEYFDVKKNNSIFKYFCIITQLQSNVTLDRKISLLMK